MAGRVRAKRSQILKPFYLFTDRMIQPTDQLIEKSALLAARYATPLT